TKPALHNPSAEASEREPSKAQSAEQATEEETQNSAVEIVFEGIERRLRFLTPIQMSAAAQCISPDSRDLIFRAVVAGKANLWTMPLDEPRLDQSPRQITSSPGAKGAAQFAPDGKSFYFLDGGQIVTRKFPNGDQTTISISAEVTIDFNQE